MFKGGNNKFRYNSITNLFNKWICYRKSKLKGNSSYSQVDFHQNLKYQFLLFQSHLPIATLLSNLERDQGLEVEGKNDNNTI